MSITTNFEHHFFGPCLIKIELTHFLLVKVLVTIERNFKEYSNFQIMNSAVVIRSIPDIMEF